MNGGTGYGYWPKDFTTRKFLWHLKYNSLCEKSVPPGVDKHRWRGMIRWFFTRYTNKDWLDGEYDGP